MEKLNLEKLKTEKPKKSVEKKETETIDIAKAETGMFEKFGKKIIELGRKFQESPKKVSQAMALIMMLKATTAFAESNVEKPEMKGIITPTDLAQKADASPPFNWEEFIKQIEISYEAETLKKEKIETKSLNVSTAIGSNFYEETTTNQLYEAQKFFFDSTINANSVEEYYKILSESEMNNAQRIYFLQWLGNILSRTYNSDMINNDEYIKISEDEMFQGLQDYLNNRQASTGICGNIHTFMSRVAEAMGIEAWLQSGEGRGGGHHIFMGAIAEINNEKQIIFIDYGTLISTNTLNYQNALGIAERYHENIAIFNNAVANPDGMPIFIKSLATEKIEEAAKIIDVEKKIGELTEGEHNTEEGLKIKIGTEIKKIELTKDTFAISFYDYKNAGNPYNSLESLQAVRGALHFKKGDFRTEASMTALNIDIKNLNNEIISQSEIIGQLATDYIKSIKLNKGEYEKLKLNFGATLNGAISYATSDDSGKNVIDGKSEGGIGARLVYIDPSQIGKIWIGAENISRVSTNNLEDQDLVIQKTMQNLRIGGEIKVKEGVITNMEAILGKAVWGEKLKLKSNIETETIKIEAEVEKNKSEHERFIPSGLKIGGEIGYKMPKGEINIYGAIEKEKYKDAKEDKKWEVGVKYRIILWE